MEKQITIVDTVVKSVEANLLDDGTYSINVLYSLIDDEGNEYPRGWEPYKETEMDAPLVQTVRSIIDKAKERTRDKERVRPIHTPVDRN